MTSNNDYVEYITKEGDRMDTIARLHYGDGQSWDSIIAANPTVPIPRSFPAGLRLRIPVLTVQNDAVTRNDLPPWKQ